MKLNSGAGSVEEHGNPTIISPRRNIRQKSDDIKGLRLDEHRDDCCGDDVQSTRSVRSTCCLSDISDAHHETYDNHRLEEDGE